MAATEGRAESSTDPDPGFDPTVVDDHTWARTLQWGFGFSAVAIGLLCLAAGTTVAMFFGGGQAIVELRQHRLWFVLVDTPITWLSLAGSYLIWSGRTGAPWRRWAGLLVLMNATDAGLWTVSRAQELGLPWKDLDQRLGWTITLITQGLGWFELLMLSGLAIAFIPEVQRDSAAGRQATSPLRGFVSVGMMVWGVMVATQTNWRVWPPVRLPGPAFLPLVLFTAILLCAVAFQTTTLCLAASRHCRLLALREPPADREGDLLRSRSETENDEFFGR